MTESDFPSWEEFDELKVYVTSKFLERKMRIDSWDMIQGTMIDTLEIVNEDGSKKFHVFISIRLGGFGFGVSDKKTCEPLINETLPILTYKSVIDALLKNCQT